VNGLDKMNLTLSGQNNFNYLPHLYNIYNNPVELAGWGRAWRWTKKNVVSPVYRYSGLKTAYEMTSGASSFLLRLTDQAIDKIIPDSVQSFSRQAVNFATRQTKNALKNVYKYTIGQAVDAIKKAWSWLSKMFIKMCITAGKKMLAEDSFLAAIVDQSIGYWTIKLVPKFQKLLTALAAMINPAIITFFTTPIGAPGVGSWSICGLCVTLIRREAVKFGKATAAQLKNSAVEQIPDAALEFYDDAKALKAQLDEVTEYADNIDLGNIQDSLNLTANSLYEFGKSTLDDALSTDYALGEPGTPIPSGFETIANSGGAIKIIFGDPSKFTVADITPQNWFNSWKENNPAQNVTFLDGKIWPMYTDAQKKQYGNAEKGTPRPVKFEEINETWLKVYFSHTNPALFATTILDRVTYLAKWIVNNGLPPGQTINIQPTSNVVTSSRATPEQQAQRIAEAKARLAPEVYTEGQIKRFSEGLTGTPFPQKIYPTLGKTGFYTVNFDMTDPRKSILITDPRNYMTSWLKNNRYQVGTTKTLEWLPSGTVKAVEINSPKNAEFWRVNINDVNMTDDAKARYIRAEKGTPRPVQFKKLGELSYEVKLSWTDSTKNIIVPMRPRDWFAIWLSNNPQPLTQIINVPESSGTVTSSPATSQEALEWQTKIINSVPQVKKTVNQNIADLTEKIEERSEEVKKFGWLLPTAAAAVIALVKG
jgi:hypothetical protein